MNVINNMEIVYNKLSKKGLCKFISLYSEDIKIDCSKNKDEIRKELEKLFYNQQNIYNNFIKFYLDTEEAGQKHFYFYNFNIAEVNHISMIEFLQNIENEEDRTFTLDNQEQWYYKKTEDEILIKYIEIKKTYIHDKELDREDKDSFFKGYRIIHIPNILFFKIFLKIQKILIGIDKYSELDSKKDIEDKINKIFDSIFGKNSHKTLESIIDKNTIEDFIFEQNTISSKIDNDINQDKKSVLYAKKGDLDKILKDLSSLKYRVDDVKLHNSDLDIKTHPTYLAEQSRKYDDSSLEIDVNSSEIYWFTHKYKKPDYFRIKINSVDSTIITYSPSITKRELEDVIYKII